MEMGDGGTSWEATNACLQQQSKRLVPLIAFRGVLIYLVLRSVSLVVLCLPTFHGIRIEQDLSAFGTLVQQNGRVEHPMQWTRQTLSARACR